MIVATLYHSEVKVWGAAENVEEAFSKAVEEGYENPEGWQCFEACTRVFNSEDDLRNLWGV